MIHYLKTWPEHFRDVRAGIKTAELRLNDRNYQPGDVLVLREYDPQTGQYTGEVETRTVTHQVRQMSKLQRIGSGCKGRGTGWAQRLNGRMQSGTL